MVSTTPPKALTSAPAHLPRSVVALWRRRAFSPLDPDLRPAWFARRIAIVLASVAITAAAICLAALLPVAVDSRTGMFGLKINSVLGLVCLGSATLLFALAKERRRPRMGTVLAIVAAVIGALTLFEHLSGVDLPIDRDDFPGPTGRMGGNTALLFICLGSGLALGQVRSRGLRLVSDGLVLAAMAIALFAVVSHIFATPAQYPMSAHDPMLLPTAVLGITLCTASIMTRQDRGLGALLASNSSGGVLARRLIPVLVVAPIAISRVMFLGVDAGFYDNGFAASVDVMVTVAILIFVIASSARVVDHLDTVRRGNEAQIRQMVNDVARQAQELQRSNRELESFSYSVSHDLRAPIRHIAGFTELMIQHSDGKVDDKGARYLKTILESAEQAGKLIDELLDFSRLGRAQLATRDVDLREVVRDAWNKLALERTGRDITFDLGPLPHVQADPGMLGVVVTNLLSNAVKYTGRKTKAHIDVSARTEGDEVTVSVRDDGVGFDMKYVDKLFGVFQRLHGDEFEGIGIGLANVKRIVERHGGRAWAEGALDGGAAFHFTLPRAKGAES